MKRSDVYRAMRDATDSRILWGLYDQRMHLCLMEGE